MLVDALDIKAELASCECPRCAAKDIHEVSLDEAEAAPQTDRHVPRFCIQPSVPVRCAVCGLVMLWPGCAD